MTVTIWLRVLCLILFLPCLDSAVHQIDVTVRQIDNQFVDLNSFDDTSVWGLLPYHGAGYDVSFNIGRASDTGTGLVGDISNPPEGYLPDGSGFPPGSRVIYENNRPDNSRIKVILDGNQNKVNHIGAFFIEAVDGNRTVKITAIKTAKTATIKQEEFTKTASVGDDITVNVVSSISNQDNLRWRHNGGEDIVAWSGQTSVKIDNVRKADEGIYECYEYGKRGEGVHAIMRLIVRACPSGLYGPRSGCLNECVTCYNGGMCEEETGVCVCPPGFKGVQCEQVCGDNYFGAECGIRCSTTDRKCATYYYCSPDPVGCSCQGGLHEDYCDIDCSPGLYGADCKLTCHCSKGCDAAEGCNDMNACDSGYSGPQCQVPDTCQYGYFGELCQNNCHCKDGDSCDKGTGACRNGECADGWGGVNNCQQALPALYNQPTVQVNDPAAAINVIWNYWSEHADYGTGPAETYRVHYGQYNLTDYLETNSNTKLLENLARGPAYVIAIGVVRTIDNIQVEGILGPTVTTRVPCEVPNSSPTITRISMGSYRAELSWMIPSGDDWIACESGIESFTISYNNLLQKVAGNSRNASVIGLDPCTVYQFQIYASNIDHNGPRSSIVEGTTDNVAPSKVTSLSVTSTSASALYVSWDASYIQYPCLISGYTVMYQLINLDQCGLQDEPFKSNSTDSTEITVHGLEEYSTYDVAVSGQSGGVSGTLVYKTATTQESVPSDGPANVQTDTIIRQEITFTWEQPQCGQRNGKIISYDYKFGKDIDNDEVVFGSTILTSVKFGSLLHYTMYEFQIRANTSEGAGPFTEIVHVRTAESNPDSAPINIKVDNTVKQKLTFNWDPPIEEDRNGVIIYYDYEFGEELGIAESGTTDVESVSFTDLKHYTFHKFRVRANTSFGGGPYGEAESVRTLPSAPSAPLDLQVLKHYTHAIELQWIKPSLLNGIFVRYTIRGERGSSGEQYTATVTDEDDLVDEVLVHNLTELKANSEYFIQVYGETNGGEGPPSNEVAAPTLNDGESADNSVVVILGVTVGLLVFILTMVMIVAGLYLKRRSHRNRSKRHDPKDHSSNPTAKNKPTSPVSLSTDGYTEYIVPDESQNAYQDVAMNPLVVDDFSAKIGHTYVNTPGVSADEAIRPSAENEYEVISIPGKGADNVENPYTTVC